MYKVNTKVNIFQVSSLVIFGHIPVVYLLLKLLTFAYIVDVLQLNK